eukprot:7539795-Alexandrium_andersonii.AAC.1
MSASLVGSEMCIRDSPAAYCDSLPWPRGPQETAGRETAGRETAGRETAVSYTHLTLPTICSV